MPKIKPSDGPVAVTGASGYVGSYVVISLVKRGYTVRACLRDPNNPLKTDHLLALNKANYPGHVDIFSANLLNEGSYDIPFANCRAVLHAGTPIAYDNAYNPREVYDGAINGTMNVLNSVKKVGTVKRFIYTSSFAAIFRPMKSGYIFSESDWASDNPKWSPEKIDSDHEMAYAMAKVETERMANRFAEEDGRFDVISVCPVDVLGPLLTKAHELVFSWQWALGQMLMNRPCPRAWHLIWNIVDVRDVGESQALMLESDVCKNGWRYMLSATDESGELDVFQLQAHLQKLFPKYKIGGAPDEIKPIIEKYGAVKRSPLARCDKVRKELGLKTYDIEDTLRETGKTMIELGLVKPILK
jgi:nucleoside-diphosphate-sugar epimerase